MMSNPETNEEWTIHSLNIHGAFFQRWCASIIDNSSFWRLITTEYPVGYPSKIGPIRGNESKLDILARRQPRYHLSSLFYLPIECKKNNPDFVDWVFYPKFPKRGESYIYLSKIINWEDSDENRFSTKKVIRKLIPNADIVDDGREVRGSYENIHKSKKTKTSNASIEEASRQITLATQSLVHEKHKTALEMCKTPQESLKSLATQQVFLPIIVTTANLYILDFEPSNVAPITGEISLSKANLRKVTKLFYEYPIPLHLQSKPEGYSSSYRQKDIDLYIRKHILIVNSLSFEHELENITRWDDHFFED